MGTVVLFLRAQSRIALAKETNLVEFVGLSSTKTDTNMNVEKLKQLQANVRIGGKGTVRRKKKVVHRTATTDDKKLQSSLKKLSVNNIPGIEEVNMIKDDGTVIRFNNPKVQASLAANTFAVTGHGENKQITDLLPGILNQLGAESLTHLKKLASNVPTADGMDDPGNDADDDDDVPDLVENFDEFAKMRPKRLLRKSRKLLRRLLQHLLKHQPLLRRPRWKKLLKRSKNLKWKKTKQKRRKSESAFRSKKNKLPIYKSFAINTYLKIERVNISNYSQQNGHSQLSLSNDLHIVLNVKFCHFFKKKKNSPPKKKKKKKKKKK